MECVKCHRNIKEPLELYTGEMACPKCRNNLTLAPNKISATNIKAKELLTLAELYYNYALAKKARIPISELVDKTPMTADEMIDKSIEYCSEALKLGHPEALWRMAFFYDKDYIAL